MKKNNDWHTKWSYHLDMGCEWVHLETRYIELWLETGDQCYWDAYLSAKKHTAFHRRIERRMWNQHHKKVAV